MLLDFYVFDYFYCRINFKGSVKDRAALFLIKEGIRLGKVAHLKQKDAPPPIIGY